MIENTSEEWLQILRTLGNDMSHSHKTTIKTVTRTAEPPLIPIPVDKLFELYGNLILAGFEKDEALLIVVVIVSNARCD